ncbi:MAG: tRNA (adenosine(37)-N6)-threonylcarbamoyltransferase complex ATPase subunit type 1 TsaE [Chloroflexota bacterium]
MAVSATDAAGAGELTIISDAPATTNSIGQALGAALSAGDVVCLHGGLGAGKTHLAQGIASGAGVAEPVTSPTFTLVNEYAGRLPLAHFDFYRLEQASELDDIGFDEYLDGSRAVIIEWAGRFPARLPAQRLDIRIDIGGEQRRILHLTGSAGLLDRVRASLRAHGIATANQAEVSR